MALEAKRQLITKHKHKVSHFYLYFCPKLEFRTYIVHFHTFSYKFTVQRTPTVFGLPVLRQIQGQDKITYTERKQYEAPRIQSRSFILKPS